MVAASDYNRNSDCAVVDGIDVQHFLVIAHRVILHLHSELCPAFDAQPELQFGNILVVGLDTPIGPLSAIHSTGFSSYV